MHHFHPAFLAGKQSAFSSTSVSLSPKFGAHLAISVKLESARGLPTQFLQVLWSWQPQKGETLFILLVGKADPLFFPCVSSQPSNQHMCSSGLATDCVLPSCLKCAVRGMSFSHLSVISHKNISQLCEAPSSLPAHSHLTGAGSQSPSLRPNQASLTL